MNPEAAGALSQRDREMVGLERRDDASTYASVVGQIRQAKGQLELMLQDPVLQEGAEASLRTAINTMISIADAFPGAGELASWGADAAKAWSRYQYLKERIRVTKEGGDPSKVKPSKIDLTPDVSIQLALGTEALEIFGIGAIPTHAIESAVQLKHDMPRIRKALARFRELAARRASASADEAEAAEAFDVELELPEPEAT